MKNEWIGSGAFKSRKIATMVAMAVFAFACGETAGYAQLNPNSYTSLGTLSAGTGDTVAINTTTGTITITGPGAGVFTGVTQTQTGAASITVFDFTSINIAAGANVTVTGSNPLALLSRGNASVLPAIVASGGAGASGPQPPTPQLPTPGAGVLGGGNGGAGATVPDTAAGDGTSTLNSDGGKAVTSPNSSVGNQDGGGGGLGGPGGAGGSTAGSAVGVSPLTTLVGGGGGSGGPFENNTADGISEPGSGGGAGGGAIEIIATGTLTVSSLTSNGGNGGGVVPVNGNTQYGGGGAGGAIVLGGSSLIVSGSVDANGGPAVNGTDAGSGGGGEVALIGTPSWVLGSTTALGGLGIDVEVNRGVGGSANGTAGTIEAQTLGVTAPTGQTATFDGTSFTNVIPVQMQAAATPAITVTLGTNLILDGGSLQFTGTGETFGPTNTFAVTSNGGMVDTQGFTDTVSSTITGAGNLKKVGSGTLILNAANTYSGGTTLSAGTLVAGNSTALGTGGFSQTGGTLETDGVNHTITVGNGTNGFDQTTGTLAITLNGAPGAASNDQVHVTGTAALDGTLDINYTPITAASTATYTIVTTTAGITSVGAGYLTPTLTSGALILHVTGEKVGDDFDITISTSQGSFGAITGLTPNQQQVASYIDRFAGNPPTGALGNLVNSLDAISVNSAALGNALNQLMPLNFARFTSSTAFNNTDFLVEQMDNYFADQRGADGAFIASKGGIDYSGLTINDPDTAQGLQEIRSHLLAWNPAPTAGLLSDSTPSILGGVDMKDTKAMAPAAQQPANLWNVFVAGDVVLGQDFSDPETGLGHDDSTTGGVRLGADYAVTPHLRVGALFDYSHTDATLDAQNSSATVDSYMPGAYASYAENGWFANAIGTYGFSSYTQARNVSIPGFDGTANSAPTGDEIIGDLDGGYDFHSGRWTFGPTAGLKFVHLDVNGYSETGLPAADLAVNRDEANSLRGRIGGRVSYAYHSVGMIFTPHLDASWQHEFMDPSRGITSQFSGVDAGTFDVTTQNPSRESALVNLGMDTQVDQTFTVFVNYTVQAAQDNYFGQAVQAGVKIGF